MSLRTAVLAAGMLAAAETAGAASFDLTAQGQNVLVGDDPGEVSTLLDADANKAIGAGQRVETIYTAAIRMTARPTGSDAAWQDYIAFCIQIDQGLSLPSAGSTPNSSYTLDQTHFDARRRDLLATLFENAFDPTGDAGQQAAFQLAVWKMAHSDTTAVIGPAFDMSADLTQNLQSGYFNFDLAPDATPIADGFRNAHPDTWAKAESYLEGLDGDGVEDWETVDYAASNLSIFVSPTSQNVIALGEGEPVTVSSMPVPAGLPLVLTGLGALGLLRRRARARNG